MTKRVTIIGIIFLSTVVMLVWGLNYLKGKNVFDKGNRFFTVYEYIDGLAKASPVMINGFKVGHVDNIYFSNDESGKIIAELLIDKKFKIPKESIAEIYNVDLLGTKAIRIIRNKKKSDYHSPNDTLKTKIEVELKDVLSAQVGPIKEKGEHLMASMDTLLMAFQTILNKDTRANLISTFKNINRITQSLSNTTVTLDTMLVKEKGKIASILSNIKQISTTIKNNNNLINNTIKNFSEISDSIKSSNFTQTIAKANATLTQAELVFKQINSGKGTLGMLLKNDSLAINLQNTSLSLNHLIDDIKESPKKYVHFSAFSFGGKKAESDTTKTTKKKEKKKKE